MEISDNNILSIMTLCHGLSYANPARLLTQLQNQLEDSQSETNREKKSRERAESLAKELEAELESISRTGGRGLTPSTQAENEQEINR
jgi:hypothetical protein